MSNETVPSPSLSQTLQGVTIENQFFLSSFAMLSYASLLHFPDEVTYIWGRGFSLPTCFYLLSKYPIFFYQIIYVIDTFLSETSMRTCNYLGFVSGAISILPLIGVRGLVSIKTYVLCQGWRRERLLLTITIFVTFLFPIIITLYELTIPRCKPPTSDSSTLLIIRNAAGVPSDVLAFIVVYREVWGLLRLVRGLGLQVKGDSITWILLEQGIGGFCFLLFITPLQLLIALLTPGLFSSAFGAVPNTLSSLLICGSVLDLRRCKTKYNLDSDQSTLASQRDLGSVASLLAILEDLKIDFPDGLLQSIQDVPSEGIEGSTEGVPGRNHTIPV